MALLSTSIAKRTFDTMTEVAELLNQGIGHAKYEVIGKVPKLKSSRVIDPL